MDNIAVQRYIDANPDSFSIKCTLFILDGKIQTRTNLHCYPSALDYCLNEFYNACVIAINKINLKLNAYKKLYAFDEFKYIDYVTFQKKEWEKINRETPDLLAEFLDKVKLKLEETYDRFYRDAKISYANKLKAEAVEETSLYLNLKDK